MNQAFVATVTPPDPLPASSYWFIFRGFRLLVHHETKQAEIPRLNSPAELGLNILHQQYLGYCTDPENGFHAFTAVVPDDAEAPGGMTFQGLRSVFGHLEESMFWLAGRAVQIAEWDRSTQFCGHCGVRTEAQAHERAKKCPRCRRTIYPRLSPAIIVLVEKVNEAGPNELLLARSLRHPPGLYSVLAGFVEPGETLETAVRREVKEEVGIDIKNIRYFGSQPWPFPDSLMIAYTAEYAGGNIVLEEEEMAEADWYTADHLPQVPPSISIARKLIDDFTARNRDS